MESAETGDLLSNNISLVPRIQGGNECTITSNKRKLLVKTWKMGEKITETTLNIIFCSYNSLLCCAPRTNFGRRGVEERDYYRIKFDP
jgi:hypothetical protein